MPDENTPEKFHTFDQEPPTGPEDQTDTTEHADINHRLEADFEDESPLTKPEITEQQSSAIEPTPAVVSPVQSAVQPVAAAELPPAGPGMMVLQWLTYAFWGWTVLSLSGLILLVVNQLMTKMDGSGESGGYWFGGGIAYLLAAVLVLFVIALICDVFYSRAEKKHSRGSGTNVIMIIHAVIFALFGIGALIMSVFGIVSLLIGDSTDTSSVLSTVISGAIIAVLYGMTLLRTLQPRWIKAVAPMYWLGMTIAIVIAVTLGVVGPAANARLQRQDSVVEQGLPGVADAINDYVSKNAALPTTLGAVTVPSYDEETKQLLRENLVKYTPGESIATSDVSDMFTINKNDDQFGRGGTVATAFVYKLCVTYKTNDDYDSYRSKPYIQEGQKYPTSLETYGHEAGDVCYELQTEDTY
ncbi:hypothetical protein H7142_00290 [Candidatus Saccharibacteria bacterium]|nr:hypothetical protein [Candidatus Saccharibacteria bacterium]